jgi:hypothetical protein
MVSSNPTMVDVARLIAEGKVADDYRFFVILIALGILAALVLWFVAPYLGERGKLLALAEKLQDRLAEIRQTTEVAENVRTRIAHSDWTTKEYKILLRNKLEHLMSAAYKAKAATETDSNFLHENSHLNLASKEPALEVQLLSAMYFEVLGAEVNSFMLAHTNFSQWLISARSKIAVAKLTVDHEKKNTEIIRSAPGGVINGISYNAQLEKYRQARENEITLKREYVEEYRPFAVEISNSLKKLEDRAGVLMKEYIAPTVA